MTSLTQPRGARHHHEVEDLGWMRPQRLNFPLQTIWSWRRLPASLLPKILQKDRIFVTHLATWPRFPPLPAPARPCRAPLIRDPALFHQKRPASRPLAVEEEARAEVLRGGLPSPARLPNAPHAPRRRGGGGRRDGQGGREGLQGHKRPQPP